MIKYTFDKKYGDELLIDLVSLKTIEPYLRGIKHSLGFYEILLIESGTGTAFINGTGIPIRKKTVFLNSPGQVRYWEINKMPEGITLIFDEHFLLSFFNDPLFLRYLPYFNTPEASFMTLDKEEFDQLRALLENVKYEISLKQKDHHMIRAFLYQMLMMLKRKYSGLYPSSEKSYNNYVFAFIQLLNTGFKNNHSVDHYAGELHITASHLNDLVKKNTGTSAKKMITGKIVTEAKRLLSFSQLSVAEIGSELGFNDTSYFIRFFRQHAGTTPLRFRIDLHP